VCGGLSTTKSREGGLIVGVEVASRAASFASAVAPELASTTTTAESTASAFATKFPTALSSVLAAVSAPVLASVLAIPTELAPSTTATTTASATTIAGVSWSVVLAVQRQRILVLLVSLLTPCLATGTCDEVLLFCVARERGTFWELLLGALVGFASSEPTSSKSGAFLGQLLLILIIGLGVILWFRRVHHSLLGDSFTWSTGSVGESWIGGSSIWREAWLVGGLSLSDRFASLLIVPFRVAVLPAPSVRSLLLVVAGSG